MQKCWVWSVVIVLLWASAAVAEDEVLFLPDNPDSAPVKTNTKTKDDDGDEVLFLPDNPAAQTPPKDIKKPAENKSSSSAGASRIGFFKGKYTALTALDTSFDGEREDIWELYQRLDLGIRYDVSSVMSVQLEGRMMHWYGVERADDDSLENGKAHYEPALREALIRFRWPSVTLTLGNQFILWGSMDLLQPAQVIHPVDSRYAPYTPGTEGLIPRLGADIKWFLDERTAIEMLWLPFFEPNKIYLWGNDFALAQPGSPLRAAFGVIDLLEEQIDPSLEDRLQSQLAGTQIPEETLLSSTLGARITTTQANIDMALGYLWGWDPTPTVFVDPDLRVVLEAFARNPDPFLGFNLRDLISQEPAAAAAAANLRTKTEAGQEVLYARPERRHVLEADAATYLGPIGARAEVVFSPEQTVVLKSPPDLPADTPLTPYSTRKPQITSVLGFSWESGDGAHLIAVEGLYHHIFELSDDERLLVQRADNVTLAAALQTKPIDDLTLLVTGRYNVILEDFTVLSSVSYRWLPGLQTFINHILFEGPDPAEQLTLGGLLDRRDQVSAGLSWTF